MKNTKILCTIGPSSDSESVMRLMVEAGMNAARINTAHGKMENYEKIIQTVRRIADIPIVLDIKGPELRLRSNQDLEVKKGENLEIGFGKESPFYFSYNCIKDIKVGDTLLMRDGLISSTIQKKEKKSVTLHFTHGGLLKNNSNVNVIGRRLNLPPLSAKDKECIAFAVKHNVEYIALSFTRDKKDILRVRNLMGKVPIGIIAKIENHEGVDNIDEIIEHADGVMVARGDLGVEIPLQQIPLLQKEIISRCNQRGKLVITATQMLESMIENNRPTRAEASDVANAILDGSDALMLSGETASGKHPVHAVSVMSSIAREVEPHVKCPITANHYRNASDAITKSIYELCLTMPIDRVVSITDSGYTARMMARFHMNKPIIAMTPNAIVKRQLELYYSVRPVLSAIPKTSKVMHAALEGIKKGFLHENQTVVFTAGIHSNTPHTSNMVSIHSMKELLQFEKDLRVNRQPHDH